MSRTDYTIDNTEMLNESIARSWRRHREVCQSLADQGLIRRNREYPEWAARYAAMDQADDLAAAADPLGTSGRGAA